MEHRQIGGVQLVVVTNRLTLEIFQRLALARLNDGQRRDAVGQRLNTHDPVTAGGVEGHDVVSIGGAGDLRAAVLNERLRIIRVSDEVHVQAQVFEVADF